MRKADKNEERLREQTAFLSHLQFERNKEDSRKLKGRALRDEQAKQIVNCN